MKGLKAVFKASSKVSADNTNFGTNLQQLDTWTRPVEGTPENAQPRFHWYGPCRAGDFAYEFGQESGRYFTEQCWFRSGKLFGLKHVESFTYEQLLAAFFHPQHCTLSLESDRDEQPTGGSQGFLDSLSSPP